MLVESRQIPFCKVIDSWLPEIAAGRAVLLKYENLLQDFDTEMAQAFSCLDLSVPPPEVRAMKKKYSFSSFAQREQGEEDRSSHYRKGVSGDWRNYFDSELAEMFDEAYGTICDKLRYGRAGSGTGS